jgi:hypothetical protein
MFTRRIILSAGCKLKQPYRSLFTNLFKKVNSATILQKNSSIESNLLKTELQLIHLDQINNKKDSKVC